MSEEEIHILLIDDVHLDIREIKRQLGETMTVPFAITHLNEFTDSIALLKANDPKVDVVILDLGLTCNHSPKTLFKRIDKIVNEIPIIVITGSDDHDLALYVMNSGASDNMTRGDFRKTHGKLRDAIDFSLARCLILKSARKVIEDSDAAKAELMAYISGGYSYSGATESVVVVVTPEAHA